MHDVRDFLGHANITTTSRYLRSSTFRLASALERFEAVHDGGRHRTPAAQSEKTPADASSDEPSELLELEEDTVVTQAGVGWNLIGKWLTRLDAVRRTA